MHDSLPRTLPHENGSYVQNTVCNGPFTAVDTAAQQRPTAGHRVSGSLHVVPGHLACDRPHVELNGTERNRMNQRESTGLSWELLAES